MSGEILDSSYVVEPFKMRSPSLQKMEFTIYLIWGIILVYLLIQQAVFLEGKYTAIIFRDSGSFFISFLISAPFVIGWKFFSERFDSGKDVHFILNNKYIKLFSIGFMAWNKYVAYFTFVMIMCFVLPLLTVENPDYLEFFIRLFQVLCWGIVHATYYFFCEQVQRQVFSFQEIEDEKHWARWQNNWIYYHNYKSSKMI